MPTAGETLLRFLPRRSARKSPYRVVIARGHDIRAFDVKPWLARTVIATAVGFGSIYFSATGYLVFRDDLLAASLARQARMQQAYEDRIASLRSDIDRLTSRQLLNQEAFESRLEDLLGRQAALDARQDIIATLSQAARGAGLSDEDPVTPVPRPRPTVDGDTDAITTGSVEVDPGEEMLAGMGLRRETAPEGIPAGDEATRMVEAESSLDALAREQVEFVEGVATVVSQRSARIAAVLEKLGHDAPVEIDPESAIGGPFMPLDEYADPEAFRANVDAIAGQIEHFAQLRETAARLPLARPIAAAPVTSGFGARMDPFLRRPAMHAGLDFRASRGSSVAATAGGTVVSAGYSGGYGYMVEVDHGGGVTTRYAHLSKVLVRKGNRVEGGDVVGRTGSTGRSTGPHLHYEVRVNGRAIDPMRYIRAGQELIELL